MRYDPYAGGFFYDNLPVVLNDNRGCDLQDVDCSARPRSRRRRRYPYQPVDANPVSSATITKTVYNEFDKSLSYYPKGAGATNNNARIVVAHANDVNGEPFAGEMVCFYVDEEADGFRAFNRPDRPGQPRRSRSAGGYAQHERSRTSAARSTTTATRRSRCSTAIRRSINVIVEYVDEGLLRTSTSTSLRRGPAVARLRAAPTVKPATGAGHQRARPWRRSSRPPRRPLRRCRSRSRTRARRRRRVASRLRGLRSATASAS